VTEVGHIPYGTSEQEIMVDCLSHIITVWSLLYSSGLLHYRICQAVAYILGEDAASFFKVYVGRNWKGAGSVG
jgi:hypothetical protein